MEHQTKADYELLLDRLHSKLGTTTKKEISRLELPVPQIIWVGQRTIFRNFMDFSKALRRDPEKLLLYLNKELASAGYIAGERIIFLGRKPISSFGGLIDRYVKDYVIFFPSMLCYNRYVIIRFNPNLLLWIKLKTKIK